MRMGHLTPAKFPVYSILCMYACICICIAAHPRPCLRVSSARRRSDRRRILSSRQPPPPPPPPYRGSRQCLRGCSAGGGSNAVRGSRVGGGCKAAVSIYLSMYHRTRGGESQPGAWSLEAGAGSREPASTCLRDAPLCGRAATRTQHIVSTSVHTYIHTYICT